MLYSPLKTFMGSFLFPTLKATCTLFIAYLRGSRAEDISTGYERCHCGYMTRTFHRQRTPFSQGSGRIIGDLEDKRFYKDVLEVIPKTMQNQEAPVGNIRRALRLRVMVGRILKLNISCHESLRGPEEVKYLGVMDLLARLP